MPVLAGCALPVGGGDDAPTVPPGDCAGLAEAACLARDDCHAGYEVFPCRNILGYCPSFLSCEDGAATCDGEPSCERIEPFCAGPYVVSHVGLCYGPCVRADQCAGCREDKLAFTRATGCENDGSVELCIAPELAHAVELLAPTITCAPGGGRAGCDPATQLLCLLPTGPAECESRHGALTDEAWDTVCALTMLPAVARIVPTWFE